MNVVRYEPWSLFDRVRGDMNRMLDEVGFGARANDQSDVVTSHWTPAVDIREEPDRFVIEADVPGVDPKDIDVTMDKGVLTIKGERRDERGEKGNGYERVERRFGTFYRRFGLPESADAERVTAKGKNGVLEVVIPKQEKLQPRRIAVS